MSSRANATIALCLLAAAGEVALLLATIPEWPQPFAAGLAFVLFLIGPLVFLAVIVWRRRANPGRIRLLFIVSVAVASVGLAVFAIRAVVGNKTLKHPALNPAFVPLGQWLIVLAAWMRVNTAESREKRRR